MACPSVVLHETGQISSEEFGAAVIDELGLSLSAEAFMFEFANWLTAPLPGAFELVERIPKRCRVAILSNMSAYHWARIKAMGLPPRLEASVETFT